MSENLSCSSGSRSAGMALSDHKDIRFTVGPFLLEKATTGVRGARTFKKPLLTHWLCTVRSCTNGLFLFLLSMGSTVLGLEGVYCSKGGLGAG